LKNPPLNEPKKEKLFRQNSHQTEEGSGDKQGKEGREFSNISKK